MIGFPALRKVSRPTIASTEFFPYNLPIRLLYGIAHQASNPALTIASLPRKDKILRLQQLPQPEETISPLGAGTRLRAAPRAERCR